MDVLYWTEDHFKSLPNLVISNIMNTLIQDGTLIGRIPGLRMSTAFAGHITKTRTEALRVQNEEINAVHTSTTNNEDQQKVFDIDDIRCQTNRDSSNTTNNG